MPALHSLWQRGFIGNELAHPIKVFNQSPSKLCQLQLAPQHRSHEHKAVSKIHLLKSLSIVLVQVYSSCRVRRMAKAALHAIRAFTCREE